MSRWAFVADVHVGNHALFATPTEDAGINSRARRVIDTLAASVSMANTNECTYFCVLGDLFDISKPNPALIDATAHALRQFEGEVILLRGNHDMVSEGESVLRVFYHMGFEPSVVETPALIDGCLLIPYSAREPMVDSVRRMLETARYDEVWCVGVHAGISDERTPPLSLSACTVM